MRTVCPHCGKEFKAKKKRKEYSPGKHDPLSKLKRILYFLKKQEKWVWIRRIARQTKMKPYSASYLMEKYLSPYLEILEPEDVLESTGIKMKMFKLKNPDLDIKRVIKELKVKTNS